MPAVPTIDTNLDSEDQDRFNKIIEEMLPCPFCGKKEHEGLQTLFYGVDTSRDIAMHLIHCTPCGFTMWDDRRDKVLSKWGTRNGISPLNQPK